MNIELSYRFGDADLLAVALTHRSAGRPNNERLEFLGDAVVGLIVAEALYQRFPKASEGELTRLRAAIVREGTLAHLGRLLKLGEHIRLGAGETRSGGSGRDSIVADAFEALVGAVFLDGGLERARATFLPLFAQQIEQYDEGRVQKDPKTALQELMQGRGLALPVYELVETAGADHNKTFFARCRLPALGIDAVGEGGSRRAAETQAAELVAARVRELETGRSKT